MPELAKVNCWSPNGCVAPHSTAKDELADLGVVTYL